MSGHHAGHHHGHHHHRDATGNERVLGERFHIHHSTIQVESGKCPAAHGADYPQHA